MMHRVLAEVACLLCLGVFVPTTAGALTASYSEMIFGHQVQIEPVDTNPYSEKLLKVDGRELQRNQSIDIEEVAEVDGVGIAIGNSSNGGNMCDAAPFVLSFPAHGPARLDGPLDSCDLVKHFLLPTQVSFSTTPLPGAPADTWSWTDSRFQSNWQKSVRPRWQEGLG